MKIFLFCKQYLSAQKYRVAVFVILTLLSSAIGIISPYIVGKFLDNLVAGADKQVIFRFCIIYGGFNILKIIKDYINSIMFTKMQVQMSYDLNMRAIKHVQSMSLSFINRKDGLYLNQRINIDSLNLITFCLTTLQGIVTNFILIIVPFVILLVSNRLITVLMVGFMFVYIALYLGLRGWLYRVGLIFKESQAKLQAKLYEQLRHIKLIKVNSVQPEMNSRAEESFADFRVKAIRSQRANFIYSSLDGIISTLAQITLFVVGGLQVAKGNFTVGMFTVFFSYFSMIIKSTRYFYGLGSAYQNALSSYDRIKSIFKYPSESRGSKMIEDVDCIELQDVSFDYNAVLPDADEPADAEPTEGTESKEAKVIDSFSAKFEKGNLYAIAGPNGTGKSTLIGLLIGLYIDEYTGAIKYNDVSIRELDMVSVRKKLIGFAEQEPLLVNASVWYNLAYNDHIGSGESDSASIPNALIEYIDTLSMKSFIDQNGLSFIVNDKNTNLSGGEKQKIAILKVLYKNPAVMIFDEPTSALDKDTTGKFIDYLQRIKDDKIIIIVTHDEYVQRRCDAIIQM